MIRTQNLIKWNTYPLIIVIESLKFLSWAHGYLRNDVVSSQQSAHRRLQNKHQQQNCHASFYLAFVQAWVDLPCQILA